MTKIPKLIGLSAFLALNVLLLLWLDRQATSVPLQKPTQAKVACLSYAPFRRPGHSPFIDKGRVTVAHIREDLALLKPYTDCVRTYAVTEGLEAVPAVARDLGMKVLQGIWIGRDHDENLTQIAAATKLVNQFPDVVQGLIVGNEVLLRREQTRWQIAGYLKIANESTQVPVTYADVWEFWLENTELAQYVDFVTVHILPYWEDHPVAIEDAVSHVLAIREQVQQVFAGRRLLIGETGWPSTGRMRGPARPGTVEQARFVREFLAQAHQSNLVDYNLIEAFDQPWKRQLEGAMGAGWGLLNASGKMKFKLDEPVAEQTGALRSGVLAGTLLGLFLSIASAASVSRNATIPDRFVRQLLSGAAGFFAGAVLPAQAQYLMQWSRTPVEWLAGLLVVICGLALIARLPWLEPGRPIQGVGASGMRGLSVWSLCRLAVLFGLALMLVLHTFDARYRGFPTLLYLPASTALIYAWITGISVSASTPGKNATGGVGCNEEQTLALIVLVLTPFALWPELPYNHQSIVFAVLAAVTAVSCLPARAKRVKTSSASNDAIAPGSGV